MSRPSCYNCVYAVCDPELWLRWQWMGLPLVPQCANHPLLPGRLQEVTGTPCCNYRAKPTTPTGNVRLIPLTDGFYAYVDAGDYEWLSGYTWWSASGYAARSEKGRTIFMHREIMQPPPGMIVDHADGNRANNCRFNLRICTPAENQRNRRARGGSSSRFKGVSYDKKRRRWCACGWFEGTYRWLGYFDEDTEAARAYDRAAVECFGEFARLNFPGEWPPERKQQVHAPGQAEKERDGPNGERNGMME